MQGLADHRQRVRHDEVVHRDHEHRDTAGQVRPERLSHSQVLHSRSRADGASGLWDGADVALEPASVTGLADGTGLRSPWRCAGLGLPACRDCWRPWLMGWYEWGMAVEAADRDGARLRQEPHCPLGCLGADQTETWAGSNA